MLQQHSDIPSTVLIVDTDLHNRTLIRATLKILGHNVIEAVNRTEALQKLSYKVGLVMFTHCPKQLDGIQLTRRIRKRTAYRDVPILALINREDHSCLAHLLANGTNDYLFLPFDEFDIQMRIASLLRMKLSQDALKKYGVTCATQPIENGGDALEDFWAYYGSEHLFFLDNYSEAIKKLCHAVEYREQNTGMHIIRVSKYCEILAKKLSLSQGDVSRIRVASMMHDIGKICIPEQILCKPCKLDKREWQIMKLHTTLGGFILHGTESAILQAGEVIALSHHEKWDGSGYPKGLMGEEIPLYGRICILADTFDVLTSKRPYKKACSIKEALLKMRSGRSTMYEPQLYDLFVSSKEELANIMEKFPD